MIPMKEIGECLISVGEEEYFFRPSFINMTRIGEPKEIVQAFYELHHDEISNVLQSAFEVYGLIPEWLIQHIKSTSYGRKAVMASMTVLAACCDHDVTQLIGEIRPAKASGKTFKIRRGSMDEFDMLVIAQSLITHGIIGKAKVRKLQRHESGETTTEFNAFEYISAARNHFGMSRTEASQLTMTEFQMLLAAKYPDQKGFTREEYDSIADEYLAKQAVRRENAKKK
ncbi:DUF6246 family protein [Enterobacter asburiae]|uniref:DUF6246 family protein n=1 Tax=Enterobacter TaxID=547 RepID=UPI0005390B85|nr:MULTISPECIES: DUF6246 family protein [Enterobacter]AVG33330.1 hypothetical protein MC67_00245 [Enterobacter cloacae complex sp.]EJY4120702.1 hypothetical protein [Enterobacter asburiae]MDK9982153.1 DUF6246 family protein [Enterobacter asburiae]MDK9990912.1 DUF6246 family protein [Enterobacter asburiae]QLW25261.1 hypothetical protein HV189_06005 [Enterobacter sp. RHBSTW-00422]